MRKFFAVLLVSALIGIFTPLGVLADDSDLPAAAESTVDRFLTLIDQGSVKETYELAAPFIRAEQNLVMWSKYVTQRRENVGDIGPRKRVAVKKANTFADLPDGEYYLVTFETAFSAHPESKETVALTPDGQGAFYVVGYEVRYNLWPEAIKMVINGIVVVFFIMALLATMTWGVGRLLGRTKPTKPAAGQ